MLKERIVKNQKSIKVMPGPEGKYELFFGTFTLKDAVDAEPEIQRISYWELPEAYEKTIDHDCYVYIAEKKDGEIIDSFRFFFKCGNRKPSLSWSIEKMGFFRRFEPGATEIIIRWNGNSGEPIRSEYVYLYLKNNPKEHYQFLSDYIGPAEKDGDDAIERYVFFPGDGSDISNYCIGFDPLVQEKYNISRN